MLVCDVGGLYMLCIVFVVYSLSICSILLDIGGREGGSPIKNGHNALQSLEAIDMLPVTPTFLVMSRTTHFSSAALKPTLALIYPKY